MPTEVGERAPDFTLSASQDGKDGKISLGDYRGQKHVVLTFHVIDFTGNEERG